MKRYNLEWRFVVETSDGDVAGFERQADRVMDELVKLCDVCDYLSNPSVALNVGVPEGEDYEVEVEIAVESTSLEEALRCGKKDVRTAIHAAGGFTPGWDDDPATHSGRYEYEFENVQMGLANV